MPSLRDRYRELRDMVTDSKAPGTERVQEAVLEELAEVAVETAKTFVKPNTDVNLKEAAIDLVRSYRPGEDIKKVCKMVGANPDEWAPRLRKHKPLDRDAAERVLGLKE